MISGKTRLLLSLLLVVWASASASASEPAVASSAQTLIAGLGQPAPAHTAFAEARFLQVLERPLVVSGELARSEEHTSELQSLMRISYAVFCLETKNKQ